MNTQFSLGRMLRNPAVAVICYFVPVFAFTVATWAALADIYQRRDGLARTRAMLDQIEGRRASPGAARAAAGSVPPGSPFVEGETVTVAGAAILQRVTGAIQRHGGNVLSSQVGIEGPQSSDGMVSVTLSAELGQSQLQEVLYELETGMPFLFVEHLVAQSPPLFTGTDDKRLRVSLGVLGQWQGTK